VGCGVRGAPFALAGGAAVRATAGRDETGTPRNNQPHDTRHSYDTRGCIAVSLAHYADSWTVHWDCVSEGLVTGGPGGSCLRRRRVRACDCSKEKPTLGADPRAPVQAWDKEQTS